MTLPLEHLTVESMANGWKCILLTEAVGWEEFPAYAAAIALMAGGRLGEVVDGPDLRMRGLWVGFRRFWIVFDGFPLGVTIEPRSKRADRAIDRLHSDLETLARHPVS
jgi:hypothetical protein